MRILFLIFAFFLFANPVFAKTSQGLLSIKLYEPNGDIYGDHELQVVSDSRGRLEQLAVEGYENHAIQLSEFFDLKKTGRKINKSQRVYGIKVAEVTAQYLQPDTGGYIDIVIPGKFFTDRAPRVFYLQIKKENQFQKWQLVFRKYQNDPIYQLKASINIPSESMSLRRLPKIATSSTEYLNCENRNKYFTLTNDIASAKKLDCPQQESLGSFFAGSMLPSVFTLFNLDRDANTIKETEIKYLNLTKQLLPSLDSIDRWKLMTSAASHGHPKIVQLLLEQNSQLGQVGIEALCQSYIQYSFDKNWKRQLHLSDHALEIRKLIYSYSDGTLNEATCPGQHLLRLPYDIFEKAEYVDQIIDIFNKKFQISFSDESILDGFERLFHSYLENIYDASRGHSGLKNLELDILKKLVSAGVPYDEESLIKLTESWNLDEKEQQILRADLQVLEDISNQRMSQ